jgi:16S rRNA (uracil1498-N3)-methyltransferase
MPKFFVKTSDINNQEINITGEDVNHIKNVLRLKLGDNILVCNGNGMDYIVRLERFEPLQIKTSIIQSNINKTEPTVNVTLFQGIPKSDKMDLIIQKCVELGVSKIVPVITERTIVKIENQKDAIKKTERWQKIITEAAKQCNRGVIPQVVLPVIYDEALKEAGAAELGIIPYEKETVNGLRGLLKPGIKNVSVIIGPEGGFTENEVRKAENMGIYSVTLGPRILRTETAGIAMMSILMYELGDVGK